MCVYTWMKRSFLLCLCLCMCMCMFFFFFPTLLVVFEVFDDVFFIPPRRTRSTARSASAGRFRPAAQAHTARFTPVTTPLGVSTSSTSSTSTSVSFIETFWSRARASGKVGATRACSEEIIRRRSVGESVVVVVVRSIPPPPPPPPPPQSS